jgi:hypothetical protein
VRGTFSILWLAAVLVAVGPAAHAAAAGARIQAASGDARLDHAAHGDDLAVTAGGARHTPRTGLRALDALPGGAPAVVIAVAHTFTHHPLAARSVARATSRATGARAPPSLLLL